MYLYGVYFLYVGKRIRFRRFNIFGQMPPEFRFGGTGLLSSPLLSSERRFEKIFYDSVRIAFEIEAEPTNKSVGLKKKFLQERWSPPLVPNKAKLENLFGKRRFVYTNERC